MSPSHFTFRAFHVYDATLTTGKRPRRLVEVIAEKADGRWAARFKAALLHGGEPEQWSVRYVCTRHRSIAASVLAS